MKNTGITYTSAERSPVILPEMAELLPPLSAEQSAALEEDLLRNGCYAPIIVNEDMVIMDGHNRQALCEKHGLPYTMAVFSFEDLLEAKQWALDTQKNRRNLEKWELGKKVGGGGIRYTVMIKGKESFLFHEGDKWFVEAKENAR